ncbi:MAG: hypothetical protein JWM77_2703 [Rhodospirillales bacterium]|nr:hypothetical protein [Rhodospirillales bacterium]
MTYRTMPFAAAAALCALAGCTSSSPTTANIRDANLGIPGSGIVTGYGAAGATPSSGSGGTGATAKSNMDTLGARSDAARGGTGSGPVGY